MEDEISIQSETQGDEAVGGQRHSGALFLSNALEIEDLQYVYQ